MFRLGGEEDESSKGSSTPNPSSPRHSASEIRKNEGGSSCTSPIHKVLSHEEIQELFQDDMVPMFNTQATSSSHNRERKSSRLSQISFNLNDTGSSSIPVTLLLNHKDFTRPSVTGHLFITPQYIRFAPQSASLRFLPQYNLYIDRRDLFSPIVQDQFPALPILVSIPSSSTPITPTSPLPVTPSRPIRTSRTAEGLRDLSASPPVRSMSLPESSILGGEEDEAALVFLALRSRLIFENDHEWASHWFTVTVKNVRVIMEALELGGAYIPDPEVPEVPEVQAHTRPPPSSSLPLHNMPKDQKTGGDREAEGQSSDEPVLLQPSMLLTPEIHLFLNRCVPPRHRLDNWHLIYSTFQHGVSLNTLYRNMKDHTGPSVLVVGDTKGEVFGAYVTDPWHVSDKFYGSGECFLFQTKPMGVYYWTLTNQYFMMGRVDGIMLGGGDGAFGLYVDANFMRGSSATCVTFNNPCLSSSEHFQVYGVEVWGFDQSF